MAASPTAPAVAFDPFTQPLTLLTPNSGAPIQLTLTDLNAYTLYAIKITINLGAQLGACALLLAVLLLLTPAPKRRSPIFALNALSLALNIIRTTINAAYYTSPWYDAYTYFAQDYSRIRTGDVATQVASATTTLLLQVAIETSLLFQVRVVCVTTPRLQRTLLLLGCGVVAAMAVGFRAALTVLNCAAVVRMQSSAGLQWLASATNVVNASSICVFSAVFAGKLWMGIRARKRLGLRKWGPMQVVFIMGCQTLVVPGTFNLFPSSPSLTTPFFR